MAINRNSLLWSILNRLPKLFSKRGLYTEEDTELKQNKRNWIVRLRERSIFIRHLDTGSSNGCELSINALSNPKYDIKRLGFHFVASPRHADLLLVTGPMTYNMMRAAEATFDAMPEHRRYIVTVGDDAEEGGIFQDAYGSLGHLPREDMQAANVGQVRGLVPSPHDILTELSKIANEQLGC